MKRKDTATTAVAIVLFLTFLAYAGVYAWRFFSQGVVTAEAVSASVSEGGVASGVIVREETVLESGEPYIDVTAGEGERVGAGQPVATAMTSDAGLRRSARARELELEIERARAALSAGEDPDDLARRSERLAEAVLTLTAAVARHDLHTLGGDVQCLRSLVFPEQGEEYTEDMLRAMEEELRGLETSSSADSTALTAARSGVFTRGVDGFEHLTPAGLSSLTPEGIEELAASRREVSDDAYGKLVTSHKWYFAAVMSEADARGLAVGQEALLDFGRYYGGDIFAEVTYISAADESGEVAVVFECATALSDMLGVREVSASVVFEKYDGIRVPTAAIYTDEETGRNFVWAVTAMRLERKDVSVVYIEDNFCIVESSSDENALRVGNTVVVSGSDLYEGKVIE